MAFEHKPGSFSLFKNDQKGNDRAPGYRGNGMDLDGNMIEIAAWVKDGSKGKFFSCQIKRKEESPRQTSAPAPQSSAELEDDLPF